MMQATIKFAEKGGKVFGVCNGFQILCEAGLLPGVLLKNAHQQFACKNVFIIGNEKPALKIPIAHGEGRFHADEKTLEELQNNHQIIYQYCDEAGNINASSNPNGTLLNIAGICNKERNVFGMMPHPERACSAKLGNENGKTVFNSLFLTSVLSNILA
jgi:phosphoribosylformylglycinamidine synthase